MRKALSLLALGLTGCAGSIFSHKPYPLRQGTVVEASPKRVITEWPESRWFFCGPDNTSLCTGDLRPNVCPETVPAVGTAFKRALLAWDRVRKCWIFEVKEGL